MGLFRYLQIGLCGVLMFIGVKMLISEFVHIPIGVSLGVVGAVLGGSIIASLLFPDKSKEPPANDGAGHAVPLDQLAEESAVERSGEDPATRQHPRQEQEDREEEKEIELV